MLSYVMLRYVFLVPYRPEASADQPVPPLPLVLQMGKKLPAEKQSQKRKSKPSNSKKVGKVGQ